LASGTQRDRFERWRRAYTMAAPANPFALGTAADGPDAPHLARTWTPEEQKEKLEGYAIISPEKWRHVRAGTHVRYYAKLDGVEVFRTGGFVLHNPIDFNDKRFIHLQNNYNTKARGYADWKVAYADMTQLYIKLDAQAIVAIAALHEAVLKLNANDRLLADHVRKLEARLTALEK